MEAVSALRAAGDTDPGLQREVNEDRFHVDLARGLFMVIDGVGGQAAGGKAADTAVSMLRARLERETGPIAVAPPRGDRDREQRNPSARGPAPGMERDGLRPHGRRDRATAARSSATSATRRLYKLRSRPHREGHARSLAGRRARRCARAVRARRDAAPAPQRGVSRRRLGAARARRSRFHRRAGDAVRSPTLRCSSAATA